MRDHTGQECVDLAAARTAAVKGIAELIAEHIVEEKIVNLHHRIDIEDVDSHVLCSLRFGQFFEGKAGPGDQQKSLG